MTAPETAHVVQVIELEVRPGRLPLVVATCTATGCRFVGRYWDRTDADRAAATHRAGGATA